MIQPRIPEPNPCVGEKHRAITVGRVKSDELLLGQICFLKYHLFKLFIILFSMAGKDHHQNLLFLAIL